MKSAVDNVISRSLNNNVGANILYMPYDGIFESIIPDIFSYYTLQKTEVHEWPCGNWPSNVHFLKNINYLPNRIDIDLVAINSRQHQLNIGYNLSQAMHLPIVIIDHELPNKDVNSQSRKKWINRHIPKDSIYVYTHDLVKDEWEIECDAYNAPYGFNLVENEKDNDVLVIGEYNSFDVTLVSNMVSSYPGAVGVGFSHGMKPYKSMLDLVDQISKSKICITACMDNKPPLLALIAAACGCVVITNRTRWTTKIFENEKTALMFDSSSKIRQLINSVINDQCAIDEITSNCKHMITEQFPLHKSEEQWSNIINMAKDKVFIK